MLGTASSTECTPCCTGLCDSVKHRRQCRVLTSARVGVGLPIMDSSMLVATMTGLPRLRHPCTILLCQYGTCTPYPTVSTQDQSIAGNAGDGRGCWLRTTELNFGGEASWLWQYIQMPRKPATAQAAIIEGRWQYIPGCGRRCMHRPGLLTSSTGSSAPRSPRATMAPSTASRMSSRLPTLSALSILARTPMEAPAHQAISSAQPVHRVHA